MLSKKQLVAEICGGQELQDAIGVLEEKYHIKTADADRILTNFVTKALDGLAAVAQAEVLAGEDFVVPGVAKVVYRYRAPQKKGAKYKKGDTYVGFGGVEQTAEADSKPVSEQVRLIAQPTGAMASLKPGQNADAQKEFLKTPTGRAVRKRKG